MPGEFVFVPHGPEEAQKEGACGEHVARAAQKHLPGRGRFSGKADDLQVPQHHARGCATESGEKREVLQIDDGESYGINSGAQLAERELPAEGAEEHQESSVRKQQATEIDERGEAAIINRCHGMQIGLRAAFYLSKLYLRAGLVIRRQGNVDHHARIFDRGLFRRTADGDGKGKIFLNRRQGFGNLNRSL